MLKDKKERHSPKLGANIKCIKNWTSFLYDAKTFVTSAN